MAVLTILSGYVTDRALEEIVPTIINCTLAGPLTPVNDVSYLIPLSCREKVKEVCKLDKLTFTTKDGRCAARIAPWSAEMGAVDRASGDGQWIRIWNLPLHGWCWSVILEVLKTVGELISLSQEIKTNKCFVSALVRRRKGVVLPVEIDLSLGMHKYMVLLTDDKIGLPIFRPELDRFVLPVEHIGDEGGVHALKKDALRCLPMETSSRPSSEAVPLQPGGGGVG